MEEDSRRRGIVSYARRSERITPGQRRAWERLWPRLGITLDELGDAPLDLAGWFGREAPLLVEIGSGMGETTAALAAAEPELNYLAVEVYRPGLAHLLLRADELGLDNLRLLRGDAVQLLRTKLAPGSVHGFRVFFPDPWPKTRHHKRRLVEPEFMALAASRLEVGGTLHLATDWEHYAQQMLDAGRAQAWLDNLGGPDGWVPRPSWRPVTKFEQRAVADGRTVRDLIFRRRGLPTAGGASLTAAEDSPGADLAPVSDPGSGRIGR